MAVEGIGNLVQNVADRLFEQKQEKRAVTNTFILGKGNTGNGAVAEDRFTPSAQNEFAQATAQDAGIFQVGQGARAEVDANFRFDQATRNADQNAAASEAAAAATANAGSTQADPGANPGAPVNPSQQSNVVTPAEAEANGPATTANVQVQIQALNAALPALGLTNAQIQQIDRIASLVHDFNPAAYTNLVNQFEALAQRTAQQSAAYASAGTAPPTIAGAGSNSGGYRVRDIFFHLTGVQGATNSAGTNGGGQGSAANNAQTGAATLQIDLVQFTLANSSGQTVQVQAPQKNVTAGTPNQQTTQNQVASA
jgi:hypothetical protein